MKRRQREGYRERTGSGYLSISSTALQGVYGSVSQSGRQADALARLSLLLRPPHALTPMTLLCVCPQMANLVTSLCCVVLAAVVVAYAQRRSQLGEYASSFVFSFSSRHSVASRLPRARSDSRFLFSKKKSKYFFYVSLSSPLILSTFPCYRCSGIFYSTMLYFFQPLNSVLLHLNHFLKPFFHKK